MLYPHGAVKFRNLPVESQLSFLEYIPGMCTRVGCPCSERQAVRVDFCGEASARSGFSGESGLTLNHAPEQMAVVRTVACR